MQRFRLLGACLVLFLSAASAVPASAALSTNAEHAVLMDGPSGQVLWAKDADTATPPASMSKLMTLELLFQRLKDGRIKLTDTLPVSQNAWSTQGSKMFVTLNSNVKVEDLIRGIIITSGNDACVVVAEGIGGTEQGFVDMMNARAKQIGLTHSHFVNPNGLPDPPGQMMSVMDLAKLARHLIYDYPQYYHYFSERSFTWSVENGKSITQQNRDSVLDKFPGTDGLKTGHTDAAGYGIVVSAMHDGQRLILVLNGLRYPDLDKMAPAAQDWHGVQRRGDEAARIMGMAFREFRRYPLFKPNDIVGQAPVWQGDEKTVPLTVVTTVAPTMQVDSRPGLKVALHYNGPIHAPVAQGQKVGTLTVTAPDYPGLTVPVYAAKAVAEEGIFGRMIVGIESLFTGKK